MSPAPRLLKCLLGLSSLSAVLIALKIANFSVPLATVLQVSIWCGLSVLLVAALIDAVRRANSKQLSGERVLPVSLALGRLHNVVFVLRNESPQAISGIFQDATDQDIKAEGLPVHFSIAGDSSKELTYTLSPHKRGSRQLEPAYVKVLSEWQLWYFKCRLGQVDELRVYPDFSSILQSSFVGIEHQLALLGLHNAPKLGQGMDFKQLREFRDGDTLRQVDWKSTAKYNKPISKEYQDERDQDVIFLMDCSRRMRAKDGEMSHFDRSLNALLVTSYIALGKGDSVGVMSFSGESRWLPPLKGAHSINAILNHIYDLHSSPQSSDYLAAAQKLMQKHQKRALVILITTARKEDQGDLLAAAALLRQRHLLVIASLRENFLDESNEKPVADFADAMAYAGAHRYLQQQKELMNRLEAHNIFVTDSKPELLAVDIVRQYVALKKSGKF